MTARTATATGFVAILLWATLALFTAMTASPLTASREQSQTQTNSPRLPVSLQKNKLRTDASPDARIEA